MIDQTTEYDAPAVYLPRLIEWGEQGYLYYSKAADSERMHIRVRNAIDCDVAAVQYRHIAQRARDRLVDLADVQDKHDRLVSAGVLLPDEPPAPLVDLTAWLRNKLERHFPHMRPELWQALAAVLRPFRRQS